MPHSVLAALDHQRVAPPQTVERNWTRVTALPRGMAGSLTSAGSSLETPPTPPGTPPAATGAAAEQTKPSVLEKVTTGLLNFPTGTGGRAEVWCLLIHAKASLSCPLSLFPTGSPYLYEGYLCVECWCP